MVIIQILIYLLIVIKKLNNIFYNIIIFNLMEEEYDNTNNLFYNNFNEIISNNYITAIQKVNAVSDLIKNNYNENLVNIFQVRDIWNNNYMWSLADGNSIDSIYDIIKPYLINDSLKILSYGCGSGFLEKCFIEKGFNITGYDIQLDKYNKTFIHIHTELNFTNDFNTLLLAWPRNFYALNALEYFNGEFIIYIGELEDGCNADTKFFRKLEYNYQFIGQGIMNSFKYIHDFILIYKKRK